jgi:hypothetical protein
VSTQTNGPRSPAHRSQPKRRETLPQRTGAVAIVSPRMIKISRPGPSHGRTAQALRRRRERADTGEANIEPHALTPSVHQAVGMCRNGSSGTSAWSSDHALH